MDDAERGARHASAIRIATLAAGPAAAVAAFFLASGDATGLTPAGRATLLPVIAASAAGLGLAPGPLLTAVALSASCAFMLPVATPPNAIVFSSGHLTVRQMARAGLALNLLAIALVTAVISLGAGAGLTG